VFNAGGTDFRVQYEPAESTSGMFGGNSNWRGPVWFPINMLLLRSLLQHYRYYEYFHGDNGAGLGASHQTGWTGLVARLIQSAGDLTPESTLHGDRWPLARPDRRVAAGR
jgi:hypothetical protein